MARMRVSGGGVRAHFGHSCHGAQYSIPGAGVITTLESLGRNWGSRDILGLSARLMALWACEQRGKLLLCVYASSMALKALNSGSGVLFHICLIAIFINKYVHLCVL
jgi:hypothetical protein